MLQKFSIRVLAIVTAIALLATGYITFYAPRAFAELTLKSEPEIALTLDKNHVVLRADLKGTGIHPSLTALSLVNLPAKEALAKIAAALSALNLPQEGGQTLLVVVPARGISKEQVAPLLASAQNSLTVHLQRSPSKTPVVAAVVDPALNASLLRLAIPSESYSMFLRRGLTEDNLRSIVALQTELQIDATVFAGKFRTIVKSFMDLRESGNAVTPALVLLREAMIADPTLKHVYFIAEAAADMTEAGIPHPKVLALLAMRRDLAAPIFLKEVSSMASALIDMHEAGISVDAALTTMAMAIRANPSLRELDTITSAMVDLVERGVNTSDALTRLQAAIVADPTLSNLDQLLGLGSQSSRTRADKNREKDSDDDCDEVDEEDRDNQGPRQNKDYDDDDCDDDDKQTRGGSPKRRSN